MVATYTGILREQGQIEWDGPVPDSVGARVVMTFSEELPTPTYVPSGQTVAGEPLEWQREMRQNSKPAS